MGALTRLVATVLMVLSTTTMAADVIAHRANSCGAPENSIDAIGQAWSAGADGVELDVRASSDGVVYLFHDDKIDSHRIDSMSFSEVTAIAGFTPPTLLSALRVKNPRGYYVIDLKNSGDRFRQQLLDAVQLSGISDKRLVFQSSDLKTLSDLKEALPASRFFLLERLKRRPPFFARPAARRLVGILTKRGFDGISLKGRQFLGRKYIEAFRAQGLKVNVWTINDSERARFYEAIGVDGIITDNVEAALTIVGSRKNGTTCAAIKSERRPAEGVGSAKNNRSNRAYSPFAG